MRRKKSKAFVSLQQIYQQRQQCCSTHSVREEVLKSVVLEDIHGFVQLAEQDKEALTQQILYSIKAGGSREELAAKTELNRVQRKIDEINTIIRNLYKDKVS